MIGEDVSLDSSGRSLAGTYTAAANPVAAALLITGSGRTDRDSDARLPGGRMLRIGVTRTLADALAGRGCRPCGTTSGGSAPAAA